MKWLNRKWRRHRWHVARRILEKEIRRHEKAEHGVVYSVVNEAYVEVRCFHCPDLQP